MTLSGRGAIEMLSPVMVVRGGLTAIKDREKLMNGVWIANLLVVMKIEPPSKRTSPSKAITAGTTIDRSPTDRRTQDHADASKRFDDILAEFDRLPEIENPIDPLEWDEFGLPC